MIFKPARRLPPHCYIIAFIFLSFSYTPQSYSGLPESTTGVEPGQKEITVKEMISDNEFILPYYPFEHELTRKADSLFLSYANKEALEKYKSANIYFRRTGNWEGACYTDNMIAEIYTNRLDERDLAEKQLKCTERLIKEKLGEAHPLISDTYLTYGSYHNRFGQTADEQKYLDESYEIRSKFYGLKSIQIAELNYRMGQMYQHGKRQNENAKESYNRALIVFREFLPSNHPDLIKVYYQLGSIYRYLKDYQRAIILLDQAIYNYSLDSLSNLAGFARALNVKANTLNSKKQYDLSIVVYESAIRIYEEAFGQENINLIYAYLGLAVAFMRTGEYELSIDYLDRSLEIYLNHVSLEEPDDLYPYLLVNKGECFSKLQKEDSANFYLFEALRVQTTFFSDDRAFMSYIYGNIASLYNDFKQYDSALHYVQLALIELIPDFNSMDYQQNPKIEDNENLTDFIDILALKADIYLNIFKEHPDDVKILTNALELYNELDRLSDNLKDSELTDESKLILSTDLHLIYEDAIKCAHQLYQITRDEGYLNDALDFFEKNKYMLLFQNQELARKSNELNIPFEYQFKEDSLNLLLAEISQAIDKGDPQSISELSTDRYKIDNALVELRKEIESNYPNFYQIEYDSHRISLDQLKDYAERNNALLIEYFAGDSNIYIIGVSPEKVTIHEIKRTRELNRNIDDFLNSISKGQLSGNIQEFYNNFKNSAYFVYKTLLFPVIDQHQLSDDTNIIISPDGILAQVPFEALISDLPDSNYPDYTRLDYLIRSYDISYVYSFNLFFTDKIQKLLERNNILAFSYSGIDVLKNPEKRSQDVFELPGTSREIESIRKIVRGKNLFLEDEEATETQFKTKAHDFQILHLAVHGIGDYESSINSRLVFKNQQDSLNDGNLFIYEIYAIDLSQVKLAILSACETGIGKEFQGEGVFSVARGFASAGCPSIIMSLWKVNDMLSADIMAEFYKNLKRGSKINESLRASKIHYINNTDQLQAHPGNWAAFVPLGQMNSVYERKVNPIMIGMIILIILIIPIIILIYKKSHKYFD